MSPRTGRRVAASRTRGTSLSLTGDISAAGGFRHDGMYATVAAANANTDWTTVGTMLWMTATPGSIVGYTTYYSGAISAGTLQVRMIRSGDSAVVGPARSLANQAAAGVQVFTFAKDANPTTADRLYYMQWKTSADFATAGQQFLFTPQFED